MKMVSREQADALVGSKVGESDWVRIDQERIDAFAAVTEDHQFIHTNPEAARMTPFGGTVAHGFLTLSLLSKFAESATLTLSNIKMGVNYGFDKVRFVTPVPAGSKVRGHFELKSVEDKKPGQTQFVYAVVVEIDGKGTDSPALVADWIVRQFT